MKSYIFSLLFIYWTVVFLLILVETRKPSKWSNIDFDKLDEDWEGNDPKDLIQTDLQLKYGTSLQEVDNIAKLMAEQGEKSVEPNFKNIYFAPLCLTPKFVRVTSVLRQHAGSVYVTVPPPSQDQTRLQPIRSPHRQNRGRDHRHRCLQPDHR